MSSRAAAPAGGTPQPELFDANGDGVIENWSIAHGGDSFANFDPPPSGATDVPAAKTRHADATATSAHAGDRKSAHPTTPAAMQHAHDAYQRDGVGAVPAADPAHNAPAPAAAPPPAPAPMPGSGTSGPLRSSPP